MDAVQAIAHHRQRQIEKRRRLDKSNAAAEIKINDGAFEARLARTVDEVEPVGRLAEIFLNTVESGLNGLHRQAGGSKKCQHAGSAHRFDDVRRADTVGHRSGQVRITNAMIAAKSRIAEVLQTVGGSISHPHSWRRGQFFWGNQLVTAVVSGEVDRPANDADRVLNDRCISHGSIPSAMRSSHRKYGEMIPARAAIRQRWIFVSIEIIVSSPERTKGFGRL